MITVLLSVAVILLALILAKLAAVEKKLDQLIDQCGGVLKVKPLEKPKGDPPPDEEPGKP